MIVVTKTTDPRTGSETYFYKIESYPFTVDNRPCVAVEDRLRERANHDLQDFDGILDLLGLEEIGHDDVSLCSYWAKRGR